MGIDDMMYPGRPIPAELIERYGAEFDALIDAIVEVVG